MKYGCVFLSGMIFGMIVAMLITLTILDNRIDNLQPPLTEVARQTNALAECIEALQNPVNKCYNKVGTVYVIMQDCIDIGREEVNAYNRALSGLEKE